MSRIVLLDVQVNKYDLAMLNELREKYKKNQKTQYVGVRVEKVSKEAILTVAFNVSLFNEEMGTD